MTKEIWVNARFLTQQISGVQQFAIELCRELKLINSSIRFVSPANIVHQDIARELNVEIIGNRKNQLWEQLDLPKFLKGKGHPLLLNLCNSAPMSYSNNIVTIHDLAFLDNPKWFSFFFRIWYKKLIPVVTKNAKHIITVSEFSKKELERKLNIPAQNITVIYNGISSGLVKYHAANSESNSRKKIILSVGSINPRKNIKSLIKAFNILNLEGYDLLIVGSGHANFGKEKFKLKNDRVKFLGYIKDKELWELYRKAQLFIYPSKYEGFGIPVLEALYSGCPTLAANLDVYKEVYGNFGINYSEGHNSDNYIKAIKKILSGNLEEQKLPEEILSKCSYHESAKKISELIKKYFYHEDSICS